MYVFVGMCVMKWEYPYVLWALMRQGAINNQLSLFIITFKKVTLCRVCPHHLGLNLTTFQRTSHNALAAVFKFCLFYKTVGMLNDIIMFSVSK